MEGKGKGKKKSLNTNHELLGYRYLHWGENFEEKGDIINTGLITLINNIAG